jgi:16S rRNA (adenine1518-N6/adenine1519-N6)-dimethyltransferase
MLLDKLKSLLIKHGIWAKKNLGQNFLVDEKAFDKIIEVADLKSTDNIIEVGPGTGFLTERLIKNVKHVTAVELDRDMIRVLESRFDGVKNLELVNEDILKYELRRRGNVSAPSKSVYKVVANIPYYITSPLLKHFLQADHRPSYMVVLVQKEVAEKIVGKTGKSLITIETQLFGRPEIVGIVPASSFYPAPKVDSAILKIEVYKKPLVPAAQFDDFLRLVKFGFSQKRKMLSNTLSAGLHIKSSEMSVILKKAGIDPNLRAENLEIGDWGRLAKVLTKKQK